MPDTRVDTKAWDVSIYNATRDGDVKALYPWLEAGGDLNALYTWEDQEEKEKQEILEEYRSHPEAHAIVENARSMGLETPSDEDLQAGTNATRTAALLHVAAGFGHLEVAKELLRRGAYVDILNNFGYSPLMIAAEFGHEKAVDIFLASSASTDLQSNDGVTALQAATFYGHEAIVRALLQANAHTELRDKAGNTALMMAEKGGHGPIAALLKQGKTLVYNYPSQYPADYVLWATLQDPSYKPKIGAPKGFRTADYCNVCCRIAQGFEGPLLTKLRDAARKETKKRTKASKNFGLLDEIAQEGVENGCLYGPIWHHKKDARICQHLIENYVDQLSSALVDFVSEETMALRSREVPPDKLMRMQPARLRKLMCHHSARVCEAETAEHWEPPRAKTELQSERPVADELNRGPVFQVVSSNVQEHLAKKGQDVVIFIYWDSSVMHERLSPQYERVAQILAPRRPDSLRFLAINAKVNELPPAYGLHQIMTETIAVHSATDKMQPTLLTVPEEDTLVLNDYLAFLKNGLTHKDSLAHIMALGPHLPQEMFFDPSWLSKSSRKKFDKELKKKPKKPKVLPKKEAQSASQSPVGDSWRTPDAIARLEAKKKQTDIEREIMSHLEKSLPDEL